MGCCETPLFITKKMIIFVFGRDVPWRVLTWWIFGWDYDIVFCKDVSRNVLTRCVWSGRCVHRPYMEFCCNDWIIVF